MLRRLLYLNGLATIAAVIHHAVHWALTAMFWWADRYRPVSVPNYDQMGSVTYYLLRLVDQFAISALPVFLFVSGFYIAFANKNQKGKNAWNLVFIRIRWLLLPYLIWSSAVLLMSYYDGESYDFRGIVSIYLTGGAAAPYYYVPLIIQLYLLSPFILPIARKYPLTILLASLLLQIVVAISWYLPWFGLSGSAMEPAMRLLRGWPLLAYAAWFVMGVVASIHLNIFERLLARYNKWLWLALGLGLILGQLEWDALIHLSGKEWLSPQITIVNKFFVFIVLLFFLAFDRITPIKPSVAEFIGVRSYGVYLIHAPVLELSARAVYHLAPGFLAYVPLFLVYLVMSGLTLPLIVMAVVQRSLLKNYYRDIFG
jgi:peptidoglycan/LPS O-acetylase OafA/YrhL